MRKNKYIKSYLDNFVLLSYSDLFRVSIDPRVKPEGDGRGRVPEGDGRGRVLEGVGRRRVLEGGGRRRVLEGDRKKSVSEGDGRGRVLEGVGRKRVLEGGGLNDVNRKIPGIFLQSRKIGVTIIFCLLSSTVHAECVPTPDCASIGYTSTSCDGDSLKCPFDISKLYCVPCDSSYQYTCSGTGQVGNGESCNGKYVSCECSGGGTFTNGKCTQNCTVGMYYYTDNTCSGTYNSSKTVAGLVVKDNAVIMSKPGSMTWASNTSTDVSGLTNITSSSTAQADMNGVSNTSAIVSTYTSDTTSNNAAKYCNSYTGGISGTSGDWYLPAAGELYTYLYGNYIFLRPRASALSWSNFEGYAFWSSSENYDFSAWHVYSSNGGVNANGKNGLFSVSCFLDIS